MKENNKIFMVLPQNDNHEKAVASNVLGNNQAKVKVERDFWASSESEQTPDTVDIIICRRKFRNKRAVASNVLGNNQAKVKVDRDFWPSSESEQTPDTPDIIICRRKFRNKRDVNSEHKAPKNHTEASQNCLEDVEDQLQNYQSVREEKDNKALDVCAGAKIETVEESDVLTEQKGVEDPVKTQVTQSSTQDNSSKRVSNEETFAVEPVKNENPAPQPLVKKENPAPQPLVKNENPAPQPPRVKNDDPATQPPVKNYDLATQPRVKNDDPAAQPPVKNDDPATQPTVKNDDPATQPPVKNDNPATQPPVKNDDPATQPPVKNDDLATQPPVKNDDPATQPPVKNDDPATQPPVKNDDLATQPQVKDDNPAPQSQMKNNNHATQPQVKNGKLAAQLKVKNGNPAAQLKVKNGNPATQPQVKNGKLAAQLKVKNDNTSTQSQVKNGNPTLQPLVENEGQLCSKHPAENIKSKAGVAGRTAFLVYILSLLGHLIKRLVSFKPVLTLLVLTCIAACEASEKVLSESNDCDRGRFFISEGGKVYCQICPPGTYIDESHHQYKLCKICTEPDLSRNQTVLANCTPESDRKFGCPEGQRDRDENPDDPYCVEISNITAKVDITAGSGKNEEDQNFTSTFGPSTITPGANTAVCSNMNESGSDVVIIALVIVIIALVIVIIALVIVIVLLVILVVILFLCKSKSACFKDRCTRRTEGEPLNDNNNQESIECEDQNFV